MLKSSEASWRRADSVTGRAVPRSLKSYVGFDDCTSRTVRIGDSLWACSAGWHMSQAAADAISYSAASVHAKAREWQLALGLISWESARLDEAEPLQRRVLTIKEKALGLMKRSPYKDVL